MFVNIVLYVAGALGSLKGVSISTSSFLSDPEVLVSLSESAYYPNSWFINHLSVLVDVTKYMRVLDC